MIQKHYFSALITVVLLNACSSLYYGHTKEEWEALTDAKKTAIKKDYQPIIDSRTEQVHDDKIKARTQSIKDFAAEHQKPLGRTR